MKGFMFYFLAALYLFVVFGSIYGFFVNELSLFHFKISGFVKNLVCALGLLSAGLVAAHPILLAAYRALNNHG